VRLALITDAHFGPAGYHQGKLRKLTHHAPALTHAFVEAMNQAEHPDWVVNLGDVIEDAGQEEDQLHYGQFIEALGPLHAPVLHVAGNHDQVHLTPDALRRLWAHQGPLHYTRELGSMTAIVLRTDHGARDVRLEAEQIAWLEQELARAKGPCLIFLHHPLCEMDVSDNVWFRSQPNICRVAERRRVRDVLEAAGNVRAVFNGHVHWNYLSVMNGIPYVTLQSLTENVDDDAPGRPAGAYAVVDVEGARLDVRVMGLHPAHYRL
jgi:3',5'-cyclic AMP phosphodiesterase CpdA